MMCKDCEKREPGCHDNCKYYLLKSAINRAKNKDRQERKKLSRELEARSWRVTW